MTIPRTEYVFLSHENCHHLPTNDIEHQYDGTTTKNSIDPVYMLEGSNITTNICASTKYSGSYCVEVYILKGVHEYLYFDPRTSIYYKSIPVGTNKEEKCTYIIFRITIKDYYSVKFLPPPHVSLTYNLTMQVRSLNIDDLRNTSFVGTIEPDDDSEVIDIPIGLGTSQYCLFAYIQESSDPLSDNYTSILVNPVPRPVALVISVSLTAFFFLIIMVGVIICCYLVCAEGRIHSNCTRHIIGQLYERI